MASPDLVTTKVERTAIVYLPTWENQSHLQTVVGKASPTSADLEECPQPVSRSNSRHYQAYLPFPTDVTDSEFDCLNLFIIRPSAMALASRGLEKVTLPVLAWIHGGGFAFGAATNPMWEPSRFVLHSLDRGTPVIVVFINYRLNVFGFGASTDLLQSQDPTSIRGVDFGFRDQKLALEWISRNIAAFSGDPTRVTIGGQSAGAISVHTHLTESRSLNEITVPRLFRRAIMQSGALGTLGPDLLLAADKKWAALSEQVGLTEAEGQTTPLERVDLLRRVPAPDLLEAANMVYGEGFPSYFDGFTFSENSEEPDGRSVNLGFVHLAGNPESSPLPRVDVLMGVTDCEASVFLSAHVSWDTLHSVFEETYENAELRKEIMQAYGFVESASKEELQKALVTFLGDAMFEIPVHLARVSFGSNQIDRVPQALSSVHSFHIEFGNPFPGPGEDIAHHCVELIYLFGGFHEALVAADSGMRATYREPSETGRSANISDQPAPATSYRRTNLELSRDIQAHWLDFIVTDQYGNPGDDGPDGRITVFGKDRTIEVKSLADDPRWRTKRQRWDIASKNLSALLRFRKAINSLTG
ncbi:para-nitrobenzyl esterase [Thozetella sp. PMI_491]|nr:para-nitrobenzyl esterase [Thozetella sp. PMI_491]